MPSPSIAMRRFPLLLSIAFTFTGSLTFVNGELSKLDADFLEAIDAEDLERMAELLKAGANPEAMGEDADFPPLFLAAWKDSAEMATLLLQHGANLEVHDAFGKSALHFAAIRNSLGVARVLLENGANISVQNKQGLGPLHETAMKNRTDMAALLLDARADMEVEDKFKLTPLHHAVDHQSAAMVSLLLDRRANAEAHQLHGMTPLHIAALRDHKEMALLLLESGANIQALENNGLTPLHDAADRNSLEVAEVLLWNKADIEEIDRAGQTPLHLAVLSTVGDIVARKEMVKLLLESDAKVGTRDKHGKNALDYARTGSPAAVVELLEQYYTAAEAESETMEL